MFREVTRSQGREGSSVNYSLTAPATISPDWWVLSLKLEIEQNPSIHPSGRSKLNSSRILALAVCGSRDNGPGR